MRKAQISGQIFVWIMAIVIGGLVLLFGIRFVGQQLENQDKIMYTRFVNGVSNAVDGTKFRSVHQSEYRVPSDYKAVCFVDYDIGFGTFENGDRNNNNFIKDNYPSVYYEIELRENPALMTEELLVVNTDMFLIDDDGAVSSEAVGKVKIGGYHYFCAEVVNGYVELQFEGVKGGVRISEWEE